MDAERDLKANGCEAAAPPLVDTSLERLAVRAIEMQKIAGDFFDSPVGNVYRLREINPFMRASAALCCSDRLPVATRDRYEESIYSLLRLSSPTSWPARAGVVRLGVCHAIIVAQHAALEPGIEVG